MDQIQAGELVMEMSHSSPVSFKRLEVVGSPGQKCYVNAFVADGLLRAFHSFGEWAAFVEQCEHESKEWRNQ